MNSQAEDHGHHISQQFNSELEAVKNHMMEMGGAVEKQLSDALTSVVDADSGLGKRIMKEDDEIDAMELKIDEECSLILARRQPAASDLRLVLAIIKTVRDLERIGDESAKIARMGVKLSEEGEFPEVFVEFKHLGKNVSILVGNS
ncbi:MAG: phosphate signaling complex protein PhoU, partial [Gammaproteobacteria bacterium]|nr:phosphate signaling complex protein PhoU [Gammaproteobacteria bacterium]